MTTKLSFRARALDAVKPMPIYIQEDVPDLKDLATINRTVPEMPTGMEKEEETEHHLQRAIIAQQCYGTATALVIPTPEVACAMANYERLYEKDFKLPKQLIHVQALNLLEQEHPDYDMDDEDERWLTQQQEKLSARSGQDSGVTLTHAKFEEMMDRLEKGSGHQVLQLRDAKVLLKEDDDLITAVYEYWLKKRQSANIPLLPVIKCEKRDGSTTNNPYVAFRRRTEKMQTRKNRKNDEISYEKMFKMGHELKKALSILEMVKKREKCKKELLQLTIEIFEKRYQLQDFDGVMLKDVKQLACHTPSSNVYAPPNPAAELSQYFKGTAPSAWTEPSARQENRKRHVKRNKRKKLSAASIEVDGSMSYDALTKPLGVGVGVGVVVDGVVGANSASSSFAQTLSPNVPQGVESPHLNQSGVYEFDGLSSGEESPSPLRPECEPDVESEMDGSFAFKRRKGCIYLSAKSDVGPLPWEADSSRAVSHQVKASSATSIGPSSLSFASSPTPLAATISIPSSSVPTTSAPNIHLLTDLRYRYTCTAICSRYHPYDGSQRRRGWRQHHHRDPPTRVIIDEYGEEREIPSSDVRLVGLARRRRGRGGRDNLDRGWTTLDDTGLWDRVSSTINDVEKSSDVNFDSSLPSSVPERRSLTTELPNSKLANGLPKMNELTTLEANEWNFFRPRPDDSTQPSEKTSERSINDGFSLSKTTTEKPASTVAASFELHTRTLMSMQRKRNSRADRKKASLPGASSKTIDAASPSSVFPSFSFAGGIDLNSSAFGSVSSNASTFGFDNELTLNVTNVGASRSGIAQTIPRSRSSVFISNDMIARAISAIRAPSSTPKTVPTSCSGSGGGGDSASFQQSPAVASTASNIQTNNASNLDTTMPQQLQQQQQSFRPATPVSRQSFNVSTIVSNGNNVNSNSARFGLSVSGFTPLTSTTPTPTSSRPSPLPSPTPSSHLRSASLTPTPPLIPPPLPNSLSSNSLPSAANISTTLTTNLQNHQPSVLFHSHPQQNTQLSLPHEQQNKVNSSGASFVPSASVAQYSLTESGPPKPASQQLQPSPQINSKGNHAFASNVVMVEQNNSQQQHKQLLSFSALPQAALTSFTTNPVANANSSIQQQLTHKHLAACSVSQSDVMNQLSSHGVVHLVSGVVTPAMTPANNVSGGFVNSSTALVVATPQGNATSSATVGVPVLNSSSPSRQIVQGIVNHGGNVNSAVVSVNAPFGRIFTSGFTGAQRLKSPAIVANYNNTVVTLQQQQQPRSLAIPSLSVGGATFVKSIAVTTTPSACTSLSSGGSSVTSTVTTNVINAVVSSTSTSSAVVVGSSLSGKAIGSAQLNAGSSGVLVAGSASTPALHLMTQTPVCFSPAIGTAAVLTSSKSTGQLTSAMGIPLTGIAANATTVVQQQQQQQQRFLAAGVTLNQGMQQQFNNSLVKSNSITTLHPHLQQQQQTILTQRSPHRLVGTGGLLTASLSANAASVSTSQPKQAHLQVTKSCAVISTPIDTQQQLAQTISGHKLAPATISSIPIMASATQNNIAIPLSLSRSSPSRLSTSGLLTLKTTVSSPLSKGVSTLMSNEGVGVVVSASQGLGNSLTAVDTSSSNSIVASKALGGSKMATAQGNPVSHIITPQHRQQHLQSKSFIKLSNNVIHHASNNITSSTSSGLVVSSGICAPLPTSLNKVVNSSSASSSPSSSSSISSSSSVTGLPSAASNHPSGSPHVAPVAVSLLNGPSK